MKPNENGRRPRRGGHSRREFLRVGGTMAAASALARTAMPPHWQPVSQLRVAGLVRLLVGAGNVSEALELARRLDAPDPVAAVRALRSFYP